MPTMANPLPDAQSPAQALQKRILLLAPTMGYYRGQYQLKDANVVVDDTAIDSNKVTRPQTKLMESSRWTRTWQKTFNDLDNERKQIVNAVSLPFPVTGVRIIPRDTAQGVLDRLIGKTDQDGSPQYDDTRETQSVAYRLKMAAMDFVSQYDQLLEEIQNNQPPQIWSAVCGLIPKPRSMREKFYLNVLPIELQGSSAVKIDDLSRYESMIQQSTMRMVDAAVEEMIQGPRAELATSLERLHELIARNGNVTDRSFNGVRAAIDKIRSFNFVANDDLLRKIQELETRVGNIDPTTVDKVTAANNGLLTAIASVQEEVTDEVRQAEDIQRFGRNLRGF